MYSGLIAVLLKPYGQVAGTVTVRSQKKKRRILIVD